MIFKKLCLGLLTGLFISQAAIAGEPVAAQFSTVNFNYPSTEQVKGFHFTTIHGKTSDVEGLDITVLGLSEMDKFSGVSMNLFFGVSKIKEEFNGLSLSAMNWHQGKDTGLNVGIVNNTQYVKGVNLGAINLSNTVAGANIGFINYSQKLSLIDFGGMNVAKAAKFQFGLINVAENLQGLQIGIINYAENGIVKILPLVNFRKSF